MMQSGNLTGFRTYFEYLKVTSFFFFNFCGDRSPFCGATGALFWTSVDSARGFQSQGGSIIAPTLCVMILSQL